MIKRLYNKLFRKQQVVSLDSYIYVMNLWAIEKIKYNLETGNNEHADALFEEFREMIENDDYELLFSMKVN